MIISTLPAGLVEAGFRIPLTSISKVSKAGMVLYRVGTIATVLALAGAVEQANSFMYVLVLLRHSY